MTEATGPVVSDKVLAPSPPDGFTLLEVLVAIAVLAIGFGFGFRGISDGLHWTERSRLDQTALQLAQATLARVGHDIPLVDGIRDDQASAPFGWHLEIAPFGDAPRQSGLAGHAVTVTVNWTDGRYARHLRLATLRLGPRNDRP